MSETEIQTGVESGIPAEGGGEQIAPTPQANLNATMDRIGKEILSRGPERGPNGQFQPKIAAEGANGVEVPGSPQAAPPDPAPPVIEAPQSLPADVRAKWDSFPPEAKQWLANREGEIHKKLTTDGERIKSLSSFEEVLKPFEGRLKQINAPAPEYVRRLALADHELSTNFPQAVLKLCEMYGHDPRSVFAPGAQPDPNSATHRELAQLKSEVRTLVEGAEKSKLAMATQRIGELAKDRPYLTHEKWGGEIQDLMADFIESAKARGSELSPEKAYEKALKVHDDVAAEIEAKAKAEADKKAADEAKEKAARDAKLGAVGRRPGSVPAAPVKGARWEDTMEKIGRAALARTD